MLPLFLMSTDKKLDLCAERGLVTVGRVVGFETAKTYELERDVYDRSSRKDPMVALYRSIPDGRVSYKPVIRYKAKGSEYTVSYHRYIEGRDMSIKEGDSVRVVFCPRDPRVYFILSDRDSYHMIDSFLRK